MSCQFCGAADPYHRSEMGEPLAITCCETMIWMLSKDEENAEIRESIWRALSKRLHVGDFALAEGHEPNTIIIERTDDGFEGEGGTFDAWEVGEVIREYYDANF